MKVIVVHPPMYPVNHEFYNLLAKKVELIVYQIGEVPVHHTTWTSSVIRKDKVNYKLKIFGKGSVSLQKQLNPSFVTGIIKEKPDIVLSIAFWIPSLYISILKYFMGYKSIILTNIISATETNVSHTKQTIRTIISNMTDAYISASNLTTDYLAEKYPQANIYLSLQTINVTKWVKNISLTQSRKDLLQNLCITSNKKIMLGVGNFTEKKNWKAVLRHLPTINNIHFILIGYGEQENEYKLLIKELKLEDKVSIVGKKEGKDLLEYFKISDFFIFPSLYDQFGFVIPEALASGLPVICTINAGASSLIENSVNGYLIDPNEDFSNEINLTIENLTKLQKNSLSSIQSVTLENRINEFLTIFEDVKK